MINVDEEQNFRLQNDRGWKRKVDFMRRRRDALHVECSGHMATIRELLECLKDARRLLTDHDAIDLAYVDEVIAKATGSVSKVETGEEVA